MLQIYGAALRLHYSSQRNRGTALGSPLFPDRYYVAQNHATPTPSPLKSEFPRTMACRLFCNIPITVARYRTVAHQSATPTPLTGVLKRRMRHLQFCNILLDTGVLHKSTAHLSLCSTLLTYLYGKLMLTNVGQAAAGTLLTRCLSPGQRVFVRHRKATGERGGVKST